MKVFVSYAFTGEDFDVLQERLNGLRAVFDECGVDYYINAFAPEWQSMMDRNATGGEFLHAALKNMQSSDIVLVVQASDRRSEGMLMEVGAAVAMEKKIVLAQHGSSVGKTYLQTVADDTLAWQSEDDLLRRVGRYCNEQHKS